MATWSAPGKVFLFGEHAVVYGKPGVAMAIKPRVAVTVRKSRNPPHARSPYIEECFRSTGVQGSVYIRSQLPSSSGLGSSAAVTAATLAAISEEFNLGFTREEVAERAYAIEKKVQKGRASPTDTYVTTFGGIVLITGDSKRRLPPQNFHLIIGNSLVSHSTSKMVEHVAQERQRNPEIINPILDAIGAVTMKAIKSMNKPQQLGQCMDVNHALLDAIGVGHPALSKLVLTARATGAFGAKITGAGGGGCMVALCPKHAKSRVAGAMDATGARSIITTIDTEGIRREKNE
ncbi:mevalonate kinase [Methanofollis tationis]|uniref:Mevalonate kinase n=2 Tax=Methanofollis TaxID=81416 RepID=A0A7K4HMK8_9EURY|nr:mevalonate kinase [Methanofollis tationis]HDS63604.1 mevalonate kinase [Methanofollis liminatans]